MKYFRVLLLIMAAASPARAQDCCRVEGVVRNAAGAPVANADVMLALPDAKDPVAAKTNGQGQYAFDKIRPGIRVEIQVIAAGRAFATAYALVTSFVETVDIKAPPEVAAPASLSDLNPQGGDAGGIRGTIRAPDGSPIGGAHVTVAGTPVDITTDSAGRYALGHLRAKLALTVQATAAGYAGATQEVSVPSGGVADADFALEPGPPGGDAAAGLAVTVPDRQMLSLSRAAVEDVPSVTPADAFRAATVTAAAGIGLDQSQLFLHGSAPDQTYASLDAMPWYPFPRLTNALAPPLTTASLQQTEVSATPSDADGGGRLGGVLRMTTVSPRNARVNGVAGIGLFGPSASVSAPVASLGSFTLAGRRSWPESFYEQVLDRFSGADPAYVRNRDVTYSGGLLASSPASGFSNLNGRFEIAPAKGNRAYVSFYRGDDAGNFSRDVAPPVASATEFAPPEPMPLAADAVLRIGDVQSWTGRGASAVWERQWASDFSTRATVTRSRFTGGRAQAYDLTSPTLGDLSFVTLRAGSDALDEHNAIQDTTVRLVGALDVGFAHAIDVGVERSAIDTTYDGRTESDGRLVPLLSRTASAAVSTVFAQDLWRVTPGLTLTPGVRVSHDDLASASYADPRVTASYAAAPHVVLKGAWSIDHQAVSRTVREDLDHGDGSFWTVSDGTVIPIARTQEGSGGVSVEVPGLLFDGRVYYRRLDHLTMFAPRLLPGVAPPAPDAAFVQGTGTAAGIELLVQHRDDRNTIWAGYTGGRVEYTYPTLQADPFPASFDRLHQFRVMDSLRVAGPLTVSAVWFAASGLPYTPSTGIEQVWFSSGALAYAPAFDARNSARLPAYHQLDVSAQIARRIGVTTATLGASVFNVYDRQNVAAYDYEAAGTIPMNSQTLLMRRAGDIFFKVGF